MYSSLLEFLIDIPIWISILIVFITFIYVTKVTIVGKCSFFKAVLNICISIVLMPFVPLVLGLLVIPNLDFLQAMIDEIVNDANVYYELAIMLSALQLVPLVIWLGLYVLYGRKRNKHLAVFTYLIFYMLSLFCLTVSSATGTDDIKISVVMLLFIVLIMILFCRSIIPQLIKLSKENQEINKAEFYILPLVYIVISLFLFVFSLFNENYTISILTMFLISFLEVLILITFKSILSNLSQMHEIIHQNEALEIAKNDIKTLSVEVMEALAHTIDAKDEYTKGHSIRVAQYSRMLAEKMNLTPEECENIYYMGLLHDIGKIGVPNEIINSPGRLTDEEYNVIKTHPVLGYEILSEIKSRPDLSIGARWHHERYDGKGYPNNKSGEDIPLSARIIAVADSYDAMTSNRSYRKYLPQEKVIDELKKNKGTQFDPQIVECMLEIISEDAEYTLHE